MLCLARGHFAVLTALMPASNAFETATARAQIPCFASGAKFHIDGMQQLRPCRSSSAPMAETSEPDKIEHVYVDQKLSHDRDDSVSVASASSVVPADGVATGSVTPSSMQTIILEHHVTTSSTSVLRFRAKDADRALPSNGSPSRYKAYAVADDPRRINRTELVLRNAQNEDVWTVQAGRSVREKYLVSPSRNVRIQILVQTWLPRLPKRVESHSVNTRNVSARAIPLVTVHGDSRSKKFSFVIAQNNQEIARARRSSRVCTVQGFAAETTQWELHIDNAVDAALIVAHACVLDGFLELDHVDPLVPSKPALNPGHTGQKPFARHRRSGSDGNDSNLSSPGDSTDTTTEAIAGVPLALSTRFHRTLQKLPHRAGFKMPRSQSVDFARTPR